MLSCHPAQLHLSIPTHPFPEASSGPNQLFTRFHSPLTDLHNPPSPPPSHHSPLEVDQIHMQSNSATSSAPNVCASISPHSCLASHDSGLGISTDENAFPPQYDLYGSDQSDPSYLEQEHYAGKTGANKLASPFDDNFYTHNVQWTCAEGMTTLSNGAVTPYGTAPDHYFHPTTGEYGAVQYATHRPTIELTPSECISTPVSQFKRPMLRHNSTSSVIPQTTLSTNTQGSLSVEASPCHWTSPVETPAWYDTVSPLGYAPQLPSEMIDYVGYNSYEQGHRPIQPRQKVQSAMTYPTRRKPHLRPSFSESCVPRSASPSRVRALSMGHHLFPSSDNHHVDTMSIQQLPLPPLPPSILIKTPYHQSHTPLTTNMSTPFYRKPRSQSNTPQRWRRPSSPPPADLNNPNTPYLAPVRQDPTFPGDLYTPHYKRRTSTGRWEGWCGYCQPGRWLDLKNSRYWEDKLRNHGICAKTKMRFAEPEQIRWVNVDGKVSQGIGLGLEVGDLGADQKKREGLCGVCKTWVPMDGMRTKAKDRAVGWWMHAYKCHDHDQVNEQHRIPE